MSLFQNLFNRRKAPITMEHPSFGTITYSKHDGWINERFTFSGFHPVELLIDSGREGPTDAQVDSFRCFIELFPDINTKVPDLLNEVRKEFGSDPGTFVLTGITVPSLKAEASGKLWTIWYDCVGDDHFWYGIQTEDEWHTLHPFADD